MSDKLRLFIASPVSHTIAEALQSIICQQDAMAADRPQRIRWVPMEQWHVTWLFLGNVDAERVETIQAQLSEALTTAPPVLVTLRDVVCWPNTRQPHTIVCRLAPSPSLSGLSDDIRAALPDYPADKPFNPHITLARIKERKTTRARPDWHFSPLPPTAGLLDSVILYRSVLTPDGPIYTPLQIIPLATSG
jgi:2'-5' RNA ligase